MCLSYITNYRDILQWYSGSMLTCDHTRLIKSAGCSLCKKIITTYRHVHFDVMLHTVMGHTLFMKTTICIAVSPVHIKQRRYYLFLIEIMLVFISFYNHRAGVSLLNLTTTFNFTNF